MATEEISVGDVVQLNSGGPNMTVEKFIDQGGDRTAICVWFTSNGSEKTCDAAFAVALLTKVD